MLIAPLGGFAVTTAKIPRPVRKESSALPDSNTTTIALSGLLTLLLSWVPQLLLQLPAFQTGHKTQFT